MKYLDMLLAGQEPSDKVEEQESFGLDEVHISRYAYEKAFRYAKLALQLKKSTIEIGGFLTMPRDSKDRIARDAFLTRDQVVTSVSYRLEAEDVLKAGKELAKNGQRILGWWHSHGTFGTFHSDIDKRNQMVLLNQIAPSNYVVAQNEENEGDLHSRVEGQNLIFWSPENPGVRYSLRLNEANPKVVAQGLKITQEKRIGFAYSFVVNCHRWLAERKPYCEIATRNPCPSCMSHEDRSKQVRYKILEDTPCELSDEQLIAEIKDRVPQFREVEKKKTYFLPEQFEEKRDTGKLGKPKFQDTAFGKGLSGLGQTTTYGPSYFGGDKHGI